MSVGSLAKGKKKNRLKILPDPNYLLGQKCFEWHLCPIAENMALSEAPTVSMSPACEAPAPSHFTLHMRQQTKIHKLCELINVLAATLHKLMIWSHGCFVGYICE